MSNPFRSSSLAFCTLKNISVRDIKREDTFLNFCQKRGYLETYKVNGIDGQEKILSQDGILLLMS